MIEIVESNYTADGHEEFIAELLDEYASDITGGGVGLPEDVRQMLEKNLRKGTIFIR